MRQVEKVSSALFFKYNTQLGPPYQVLIDTNFINFSIKNKIDLVSCCIRAARTCCRCSALCAQQQRRACLWPSPKHQSLTRECPLHKTN